MTIQFQGHPANSAVAYLKNFHVCFHQFLSTTKTFRGNRLLKYLINLELIYSFQPQSSSQNFHMAWHVILCSIGYIDVPNKGIKQGCSWASCDIHISPFTINLYFNLQLCLIGTYIEFMVQKSSYCKCSLAWCQVRKFLLFTIWTHPLQIRDYPSWYAGTDRNKKVPL